MLGYTSCHQLFVLQLYKLSFICSFIYDYSVIICLQFIMLWYMYKLFICMSTFPFSYTLIRSLPKDSVFASQDIGHFILWSGFIEFVHATRSWSLSTYSGIHAILYSFYYSLIFVYQTFHLRLCVNIICIIAVMLILRVII